MLQGCNKGVTMVLLYFYKGVVWLFHLCFNEVKRVLQECYLGVTKGVSWVSKGSYTYFPMD